MIHEIKPAGKNTQNRILFVGTFLVIYLITFPPWGATAPTGITGSVGHYFVFSSTPAEYYKFPNVDYGRLILEIFGVALVSGVGTFMTRNQKSVS